MLQPGQGLPVATAGAMGLGTAEQNYLLTRTVVFLGNVQPKRHCSPAVTWQKPQPKAVRSVFFHW